MPFDPKTLEAARKLLDYQANITKEWYNMCVIQRDFVTAKTYQTIYNTLVDTRANMTEENLIKNGEVYKTYPTATNKIYDNN